MSTLKSVGKKLFKTELAEHKVELGIIDDLQNQANKLNSRRLELMDFVESFIKSKNDAIRKNKELSDLMGDFDSTIQKAKKAGVDLGIEIPEINKFIDLFEQSKKALEAFKSNVK